jgi:hypothetical protein
VDSLVALYRAVIAEHSAAGLADREAERIATAAYMARIGRTTAIIDSVHIILPREWIAVTGKSKAQEPFAAEEINSSVDSSRIEFLDAVTKAIKVWECPGGSWNLRWFSNSFYAAFKVEVDWFSRKTFSSSVS